MDLFMRVFAGAFMLVSIPGIVHLIKEDIKTFKELKEKDLL